jgi:muramoyltetrapeptide carboxypeptidase LdcA involved in peptidoglycan recycling
MQNLKGISSGRITKVVRYFTMNPKKLVLHFSDFSVIFYAIYKNQGITFTIGVHLLQ